MTNQPQQNSYLDRDSFHVPGNEYYRFINSGFQVYNSQFNVAQLIYRSAINQHIFNTDEMFDDINAIFVGPAFVSLRDQTKCDLSQFACNANLWHFQEPNTTDTQRTNLMDAMVYNSSALVPVGGYEHIGFISKLLAPGSEKYLHLLIHDEAHWGANEGGNINNFLTSLHSNLQELNNIGRHVRILVVYVTATDQLFEAVPMQIVDWNNLQKEQPPNPAFHNEIYRSVEDLYFYNDTRDIFLNTQILAVRSANIVEDYSTALNNLLNFMINSNNENSLTYSTCTEYALLTILHDDSQICFPVSKEYMEDYSQRSGRNVMVFVRFQKIQDAQQLQSKVMALFKTYDVHPFEVIVATSALPLIQSQFTQRARNILHNQTNYIFTNSSPNNKTDFAVQDIKGIPVLMLVVDKLQMGERLPPSCLTFDLRARYRGDINNVKNSSDTSFIQDAGRCAGHKKNYPLPRILISLSEAPEGRVPCPTFKVKHAELSSSDQPTRNNAQHANNSQIYSKLLPVSILLKAEPQIGKTGVCMALLEILFANHVRGSNVQLVTRQLQVVPVIIDHTSHRLCSEFQQLCQELRYQVSVHGVQYLVNYMAISDNFLHYHTLLNAQRSHDVEQFDTNAYIAQLFFERIFLYAKTTTFRFADCGCGMNGISPSIAKLFIENEDNYLHVDNVTVVGIDLCEDIKQSYPPEVRHAKVSFDGVVCEMGEVHADVSFDVVVFNCSFYENSCGRYLDWAWKMLNNDGYLVMVNLTRRLPEVSDFKETMKAMGWSIPKIFTQLYVTHNGPYCYSIWQKKSQNNFNVCIDLPLSS